MKARALRVVIPRDYLVQQKAGEAWCTLARFVGAAGGRRRAIVYVRALHRAQPSISFRVIKAPGHGKKSRIQRNPAPRIDAFDAHAAAKLYRRFAGKEPDSSAKTKKPAIPDALACIGQVSVIQYIAERDGVVNEYRHPFKARSRPHLCISPDGKLVLMLGGAFTFTEDGFVDGPSR